MTKQSKHPLTPEHAAVWQLGNQIRQHRHAFNISQAELAKQAGTTQAAIARIEAGTANPTLATVEAIAAALHRHLAVDLKGLR